MATNLLITGSNGLLGQKLVLLLKDYPDFHVIATSRGDNRAPEDTWYTYESMNISDSEDIKTVFEKHQPDVVIHTAAMTNVDQCEQDHEGCDQANVYAVELLANACKQNDCHMIHLSTDFIFDGEDGPYKEEDTPNPISYYGASKLKAEQIVENTLTNYAILRTVLVYGIVPGMSRSNIVLWVKKSLEEGKTINVVTDQVRTPTLAEDLAKGCVLAAQKRAKGIFNISGKDILTPYDIAIATADFFDLDKSLIKEADSSNFSQPAKRPPKTGFLLDKAQKELGYDPVSFTEGIRVLSKQMEE